MKANSNFEFKSSKFQKVPFNKPNILLNKDSINVGTYEEVSAWRHVFCAKEEHYLSENALTPRALSIPSNIHPLSQHSLPGSLETFLIENIPTHPLSPYFLHIQLLMAGSSLRTTLPHPRKSTYTPTSSELQDHKVGHGKSCNAVNRATNCLLNIFTLEIPEVLKFHMSIIECIHLPPCQSCYFGVLFLSFFFPALPSYS